MYIGSSTQDIVHSMPQWRAVTGDIRFDSIIIPGEKDSASVAADIAGNDDTVSGFCKGAAGLHMVHDASDRCCSDKDTVYLALAGNLCVARDDADADFRCCLFHGSGNLLELCHRESLFDDKSAGHIHRLRAHAGEIIDRTADRELSDISSREKSGRDNKAVCGHGHSACRNLQHGSIIRCKKRIFKMSLKYFFNQFRSLFAAGPMSERNCFLHCCYPFRMSGA